MIALDRVGHVYGPRTPWAHRALAEVDLVIEGGERVLITGHNGSGKSTLAWILAGLVRPTEGTARLDDRPLDQAGAAVAISFQHARLQLFKPTVASDVAFGLGLDAAGVDEALARVALAPAVYRDRRIDDLSGGEMRRVALAGLLARRPRLMVLDEPLAGLDEPSRRTLVGVIGRLAEAAGLATVIVSHDLDEAAELCDRLLTLDQGRLQ